MATLADELLNDFEDTGSEGEEDRSNEILQGERVTSPDTTIGVKRNASSGADGGMELDGDEGEVEDDEEMLSGESKNGAAADVEDEEEAKARIEKMQLRGVSDVRSVAGLMKTLQPVLEVSHSLTSPFVFKEKRIVYILPSGSPDLRRPPTENRSLPIVTTRQADEECRLD